MSDLGLTHVAFVVSDLAASLDFYERYAGMTTVHDRKEGNGARVAWVTDRTRPFVVVLIQPPRSATLRRVLGRIGGRLVPSFAHLGVACKSREEVDERCDRARREGILDRAARDLGPPVGYFGLIRDPDGHTLEVAFGQDVGLAVQDGGILSPS
ncbi:MAG: VOC family protein [Deltaproteobacteria bacterium]|nr:VOC family protein [Deltaproteobacteria bacterium]MBW2395761.1 VOC family protein [Deltaproteobacteria bacterium]